MSGSIPVRFKLNNTKILVLKPSLLLPDPSDKFCLTRRIPFLHCISVYRIPCKDCDKSYVGQTLRTLDRRIKEHHRSVITGDCDSSALAEHAWTSYHQIAWTILHQHQRWFQRCILQSWYIHQVPNLLNRDSGNLPQPYRQLTVTSPTELHSPRHLS